MNIDENEWDVHDMEDTIHHALPSPLLNCIVLVAVGVPITLVLWLGIKVPLLGIGSAVVFTALFLWIVYRYLNKRAKWQKVKDVVLPEMKSECAVHFFKLQITITEHYLVMWSLRNLGAYALSDVQELIGKKGQRQAQSAHELSDILMLERQGKPSVIASDTYDASEVMQANKLISTRK